MKLATVMRSFGQALKNESIDFARRAYRWLPGGLFRSTLQRVAFRLSRRHIDGALIRTVPRRRLETWAEFEEVVLSQRSHYRGIFIQSEVIPWDALLYQRPQHMAVALGKLGYLVIFRTTSIFEARDMQAVEEIAENVWLTGFEEVGTIQSAVTSYYSTTHWHTPQNYVASRRQGPVVYEYIDHVDPSITGVDTIPGLNALKNLAFSGGVDYIVASARVLEDEAKHFVGSDRVICVPNGVDCDHYKSSGHLGGKVKLPRRYRNFMAKKEHIVGYFGAIAPWLWYSMLQELVQQRLDLGFVFIGPDYQDAARNLPHTDNTLWLGPVDYKILPAFASEFDVAIIPFEPGEIARTTSPLKLFEYFALCKPVVVTAAMQECTLYDEVLSASSVAEFSTKIDEALQLSLDSEYKDKLLERAQQNDWAVRAEAMGCVFAGLHTVA